MKNLPVDDDEKPKKTGLFDYIKLIEQKKPWNELTEEEQKSYSIFMINRLFSSRDHFSTIISKLDTMKLTPEQHYTFLTTIVDTRIRTRFDLDAYKKKKVNADDKYLIFVIRKEYEVGIREAKSYINIMSDDEKKRLKEKWKNYYEMYGD